MFRGVRRSGSALRRQRVDRLPAGHWIDNGRCPDWTKVSAMDHGHDHSHDHSHATATGGDLPEGLDLSVPAAALSTSEASRRRFLLGAGLLGAGAATSVLAHPGAAEAAGLPHTHDNVGGG